MLKSIIRNLLMTFLILYILGCTKDNTFMTGNGPITDGDYYVATWGDDTNPGTFDKPWGTWQKAFSTAQAGDVVYFRGGVWYPTPDQPTWWKSAVTVIAPKYSPPVGHDGTYEKPIRFFNYPGESPILDCSNITTSTKYNEGVHLTKADYIHFRGLTIRNVKQKKDYVECFGIMADECSNITFENISVHDIGGNAFRYAGAFGYHGITTDTTRFINCDAYNCCDSLPRTLEGSAHLGGAADGYKTWNEPGAYIEFNGCRAWNNSDDGFDPGTDVVTVITNCWSFRNGYLNGDGCGYKTGGMLHDNGNKITRVIANCIAAFNKEYGFFLLEYPGYYRTNARIYNNVSYKNLFGFVFSLNNDYLNVLGVWKNNISYKSVERDFSNGYQTYTESNNSWDLVPGFPGYSPSSDFILSDDDFVSLIPSSLSGPRKPDGSLPDVNFFKLALTSDLIGAGINVGMSEKPDIGIDWAFLKKK